MHSLKNVNLQIKDGEIIVILGPTGAGKTTLLNVIAGFENYNGTIYIDDVKIDSLPTRERKISYLFQDLNLFPHMDVFSNIAFGLNMQKLSIEQTNSEVKRILNLLKIEHLEHRYPKNLSGGEKQRIALARALVISPKILLLDEPMSSLDYESAKYLKEELKALQKKLKITIIYVTHDFYEAEEISDRICVIDNGELIQCGDAKEIFFQPNERVSKFIGSPNILECESCKKISFGLREITCGDISLIVANEGKRISKVVILPEDLHMYKMISEETGLNKLKGTLKEVEMLLNSVFCSVSIGRNLLKVKLKKEIFDAANFHIGEEVFIIFKMQKLKVISK